MIGALMFPARVLSAPACDDLSPTCDLGIELSFRNVSEAEDPYSVRDVAETNVRLRQQFWYCGTSRESHLEHLFKRRRCFRALVQM